jgi:hypothetical protein
MLPICIVILGDGPPVTSRHGKLLGTEERPVTSRHGKLLGTEETSNVTSRHGKLLGTRKNTDILLPHFLLFIYIIDDRGTLGQALGDGHSNL